MAFIGPASEEHAFRMRERRFARALRAAGIALPSPRIAPALRPDRALTHFHTFTPSFMRHAAITGTGSSAPERALADPGPGPEDVDLLIVSTDTPEYVSPAAAPVLHGRPGMRGRVGAFDVDSACAGFATAPDVAWKHLRADERCGRVPAVAVCAMSKLLDHEDRKTATIFCGGNGHG